MYVYQAVGGILCILRVIIYATILLVYLVDSQKVAKSTN